MSQDNAIYYVLDEFSKIRNCRPFLCFHRSLERIGMRASLAFVRKTVDPRLASATITDVELVSNVLGVVKQVVHSVQQHIATSVDVVQH